jgi:hypothetical protein
VYAGEIRISRRGGVYLAAWETRWWMYFDGE